MCILNYIVLDNDDSYDMKCREVIYLLHSLINSHRLKHHTVSNLYTLKYRIMKDLNDFIQPETFI